VFDQISYCGSCKTEQDRVIRLDLIDTLHSLLDFVLQGELLVLPDVILELLVVVSELDRLCLVVMLLMASIAITAALRARHRFLLYWFDLNDRFLLAHEFYLG